MACAGNSNLSEATRRKIHVCIFPINVEKENKNFKVPKLYFIQEKKIKNSCDSHLLCHNSVPNYISHRECE